MHALSNKFPHQAILLGRRVEKIASSLPNRRQLLPPRNIEIKKESENYWSFSRFRPAERERDGNDLRRE
jgi:hypothetical protein